MKNHFVKYPLILALLFSVISGAGADSLARATTTIGVILPLTGEAAFWGESSKRGIELAIADLKGHPQAGRTQFLFEDDRCSAKDAVAAFHKMVYVNRVRVILGPICSSAAAAVAPLAEKYGVMLLPFAESDEVKTGRYVRRLWIPNSAQGKELAQFAYDRQWRKIAVIATQNAFGKTLSEAFIRHFVGLGGQIVGREEYAPATATFRTELVRLRTAKPEALLFASYIKDGVTIVREARGLGFSIPLLGSSTANTPEFTTKVGSVADGLVLADLYDSSSEEFRGRWQRAFSSPYPGIQSGAPLFYDIAKLLAEYLTSHDAQQLSEYLNSVDYIGASGAIRFNAEGNLDRKHVLHRLNQGKFELLSSEQG